MTDTERTPHQVQYIDPEDLDGTNGRLVQGTLAQRLTARAPTLRALDILDAPTLIILDLRKAASGCHVTVRGCPRLSMICLPPLGEGAVLHLDLAVRPSSLIVSGPIASLDVCWSENATVNVPPASTPYRNAWIGWTRAPETRADIVVLKPGSMPMPADLTLPAVRSMHLIGGDGIRSVHLAPRPGQTVVLDSLPNLEEIRGPSSVGRLSVRRTPALAEIDAAGAALKVRDKVAVTPLNVHGPWLSAAFHMVRGVISAPLAADLQATNCPESAVCGRPGEGGGRDLLLHMTDDRFSLEDRLTTASRWINAVRGVNALLLALHVLGTLARAGAPLSDIERLHRGLDGRFRRFVSRVPKAVAWRWPTDYDLAQETWDADLDLRLILADGDFETADSLAGVRECTHVVQFATLARGVRRHRGPARVAMAGWLDERLQVATALLKPGESNAQRLTIVSDVSNLIRSVSGCWSLPHRADIELSIVCMIVYWVRGDDEPQIRLLRQCIQSNFPEARVALLRLAKGWEPHWPDLAARARLVALLPSTSTAGRAA